LKAWLHHPFRVTGRLLWLGGVFAFSFLDFVATCAFRSGEAFVVARAFWLQRTARRFHRVFGLEVQIFGVVPSCGLLVCNHLSYIDILVLAGAAPAVFVAKHEVKSWPLFGWFASMAGTLFVNREKRTQVGKFADEIASALDRNALVVLFPEGTSSGGERVLPFKSALLEPSTCRTSPLSAGFIRYELDGGDAAEEVCYWKDMTLLPHLVNLLSKRGVRVFVRFAPFRGAAGDRKELARQLHDEVVRLKEQTSLPRGTVDAPMLHESPPQKCF
jgi:1-acyl-sn-glycerol-3-phosphate acyltransferase